MAFVIRRATPDDYPAFQRLFPELEVDDPAPSRQVWSSLLEPNTWIAARDGEVLGYCYVQEYAAAAYVRNVVVAPSARNGGVGRALMQAARVHFRSRGKTSWCLNVMPDNGPALALYTRMGMRTKYAGKALRLPWASGRALPAGNATVEELAPEHDPALETLFALPRGQIATARQGGRLVLQATAMSGGQPSGLAVFDPDFPRAFPFRVTNIGAVAPLLGAMRPHAPAAEHIDLIIEDDARLADVLQQIGASLRGENLHLEGEL